MNKSRALKTVCLLASAGGLLLPSLSHAALIADSELKLDLRNFYLDRKYIGNTSDASSWSQGADLQFTSGYTDTSVQFGLDASTQGAYTLDSVGNDGSLPYDQDKNEAKESYGRIGATLKLKYSNTELKVGDHRPHLPIAWDDTSRQLDTIYEGAVLTSNEIDGLNLTAGRYWNVVTRASSDKEKLYLYPVFNGKTSDGLDFAGADYAVTQALKASVYYGVLHDIYKQTYYGLNYQTSLSASTRMIADLRYFDNQTDGAAYYGELDVDALGAMVTFLSGSHMLAFTWQSVDGDTYFPTLNGYVPQPYLVQWSNAAFISPDEQSMGARYAYNFKEVGVTGLDVFAMYIASNDIDVLGSTETNGKQAERDLVVSYTLQSGALEGLKFQYQDIHITKSFADDYAEYRFVTTYTVDF
jgi:benzoate transport porin